MTWRNDKLSGKFHGQHRYATILTDVENGCVFDLVLSGGKRKPSRLENQTTG